MQDVLRGILFVWPAIDVWNSREIDDISCPTEVVSPDRQYFVVCMAAYRRFVHGCFMLPQNCQMKTQFVFRSDAPDGRIPLSGRRLGSLRNCS